MYVSDEEDKPDMIVISSPAEDFDQHCIDKLDDPQDDLQYDAIEEDTANNYSSKVVKRPRVHFSPPRLNKKTMLRTTP